MPRPYPETVNSNRAETRQLYRSTNGDSWFLARDPETGSAFVRHQANAPSGGHVTDIELGAFLSGPRNPEHEALLRLIGASILDPHGAEADDEPPAENAGREWSDGELRIPGEVARESGVISPASLPRRDRFTAAPTGIAGASPAIPRRARPLSGTRRTPRQAVTSPI